MTRWASQYHRASKQKKEKKTKAWGKWGEKQWSKSTWVKAVDSVARIGYKANRNKQAQSNYYATHFIRHSIHFIRHLFFFLAFLICNSHGVVRHHTNHLINHSLVEHVSPHCSWQVKQRYVTDNWDQHKLTADYWLITKATQSTETNSQTQSISSHNNTSYLFAFGFFDVCSIFFPTFLACFFIFFFCLFLFDFDVIIHIPSLQQSTTHRDQPAIVHQFHLHSIHHLYNVISSQRTLLETITLQRGTTWTARVPNCNHTQLVDQTELSCFPAATQRPDSGD